MKRKEVVLFMTVGTGTNLNSSEESSKTLARKLYYTIEKIRPIHVVFFASDKSKETIGYIEELFTMDNDEFIAGEDYQIVEISAIDDLNTCFEAYESKIWEFDYIDDENDYKIIMDYTSGTKTMSAAMASCGMFYSKDLISVGGDRSTGEVSRGTEIINYQNIYKIYDKFVLMRTRYNFNANRFMACIDMLNYIVDLNIHKESLLHLCKAYYAWDNMDFEEAYDNLRKVDANHIELSDIKNDIKFNLKALGNIMNSRSVNLKNCYILASLINNSIRRSEEFKYDDAIARLYRSFELIAQIELTKYNIKSSDIDVSILKQNNVSDEFILELEKTREDGKIRIGLEKDFLLLNELGNDLGKYFIENKSKIKDLTKKRNYSILAHGLDSLTKKDFDEFLKIVLNLSYSLDKDMKKFLNQTRFAKFDLKLKFNKNS
ncbi:MAG: TIGR02710 family CRISPR-associated protein [Methanobrevibacter thaueri]|uniref:TIGR02710 family CRISPR-associated protein n=1 Tax=Methanobrevibacter thaueri TaxID=190975 RepID=A0A8T3VF57_9EURY|nr:TIGR02710 family CRISPR-associated CARF protein [Methanobrevibacter thaueri]MBE6501995.1 TIGR02710 family CRISPR-associated protein [Methanobrevibacter thaueri]